MSELCVPTPPPIRHLDTELHHSSHPIFTLIPFMDSLSKQASIPAGIHRPFFTCYLVALDLLPRPLSPPATTRSNTVSAAFPPFSCPNVFTLDIDNALFNSCGFSLLGYVLPPPFLEPPPPCRPQPWARFLPVPRRGLASSPVVLSSSDMFLLQPILFRPVF